MFDLPQSTLVNKRIPKTKFYRNIKTDTRLKNKFVNEVDYIIWKHKLSPNTVNIDATNEVEEIQVFEIHLKQQQVSRDVLESIDKAIPYPILYVLVAGNHAKLTVAYKKRNKKDENKFLIDSYHETDWQDIKDIKMNLLSGFNLQQVYEHILRNLLTIESTNDDIEETIQKQSKIAAIKKEITKLEAKMKKEVQFNRKVELNLKLQQKKKELDRYL